MSSSQEYRTRALLAPTIALAAHGRASRRRSRRRASTLRRRAAAAARVNAEAQRQDGAALDQWEADGGQFGVEGGCVGHGWKLFPGRPI